MRTAANATEPAAAIHQHLHQHNRGRLNTRSDATAPTADSHPNSTAVPSIRGLRTRYNDPRQHPQPQAAVNHAVDAAQLSLPNPRPPPPEPTPGPKDQLHPTEHRLGPNRYAASGSDQTAQAQNTTRPDTASDRTAQQPRTDSPLGSA